VIWEIIIFAILLAWFTGSLIGFLLNIGQYRRLDKKIRIFLIIVWLISLLAIIELSVGLARKLLS
jgi:ABC-type dipeptide/oligopeptide/nickel transport system permease component